MSNLTILVTGSEGATGSYLVEQLSAVPSVDKILRVKRGAFSDSPVIRAGEVTYSGDLLDENFCRELFLRNDVDIVIFFAAKWNGLNSDPAVFDENYRMLSNVLFAKSGSVKKFIFLSSSAIYSEGNVNDQVDVFSPPSSAYGRAKFLSEQLLKLKAQNDCFSFSIYRPFHIVSAREPYSPGRSHVTTDFCHRYVDLNQDFDWSSLSEIPNIPFTWAPDLCTAIIQDIDCERRANGAFNIASPISRSIYDLALSIAKAAHSLGLSNKETFMRHKIGVEHINGLSEKLESAGHKLPLRTLDEIAFRFLKERYGESCGNDIK